jgi:hypothetical protein
MTVVPQPAVHLRRATKADLSAILNIIIIHLDANENSNIPGTLPALPPTSTLKKDPNYWLYRERLIEALAVSYNVLMVVETDQPVTASAQSNHDAKTGTAKAVVGYARGWVVPAFEHQPVTPGIWNEWMEERFVQRP